MVTTKDGYMLELDRIIGGDHKVILMLHGFTGSSEDFIIGDPVNAPAYRIANDNFFDIWVINFRGNSYSRGH